MPTSHPTNQASTAPRQTAGYAPLRKPHSVRRTSSIDVSWPDGRAGDMRFDSRARDIITGTDGKTFNPLAEDAYMAIIQPDRTISAITATPYRENMDKLVGERGGGHLREVLKQVLPAEISQATPLYLILDDISGASLISAWAWMHWTSNWMDEFKEQRDEHIKRMEGICIGFRPGSQALDIVRFDSPQQGEPAPSPGLRNPKDPDGWHTMTTQTEVGMRRARRIDIWQDDVIHIDSAFQDSASTPEGVRVVLHEYQLTATADPNSLKLLSIEAVPCVLPFPECTAAPANLQRLAGTPLPELREQVLASLPGSAGCTHLNDAIRALAETPALIKYLS